MPARSGRLIDGRGQREMDVRERKESIPVEERPEGTVGAVNSQRSSLPDDSGMEINVPGRFNVLVFLA
jgi:hypothetical protein